MIAAVIIAASAALTPYQPFSWVCPTLDRNPTADGMWDVVSEAAKRGLVTESDGEAVARQIIAQCPEYIPVVMDWAESVE